MFRRHYKRRSTNIVFVILRLSLSLVMFAVLLGGIYSAYKHFSGLDPLRVSPQAVISNLLNAKDVQPLLNNLSSISLIQNLTNKTKSPNSTQAQKQSGQNQTRLAFRFALVADSHTDNINLEKALKQIKKDYADAKFVIGLGDYTEVGTIEELQNAKKVFDVSGLRYFLTAGDHDLWDSRNKNLPPTTNFNQVFGPSFQSFAYDNFKFIILYNSDNYLGLDENQLNWLSSELEKSQTETQAIFVFVHEPLFHPSSDHVMGRIENSLKDQAKQLIQKFASTHVKKVFAGDIHYFSQYSEPETALPMVTIGAVTSERNTQAPRFAIVSVFEDGSTKVEDMEIH